MSRLQLAIDQIIFARNYSTGLLDQTPEVDWFRQPPSGVSHIAWQVGHLAIGEYRLGLWRIRGEQPDDFKPMPAIGKGVEEIRVRDDS